MWGGASAGLLFPSPARPPEAPAGADSGGSAPRSGAAGCLSRAKRNGLCPMRGGRLIAGPGRAPDPLQSAPTATADALLGNMLHYYKKKI